MSGCRQPAGRPGDGGRDAAALEPRYQPVPAGAAPDGRTPSEATSPSSTSPPDVTQPSSPAVSTTAVPTPTTTASFLDPVGDLTPSPTDPPPAWADLAGAELARTPEGWVLRIGLAGPPPPTGDGERTMNIASFYDTDGNGTADYEVWVNLADTGWGGSWFDNTTGRGHFGRDAGVTAAVDGNGLVVRFPLSHLAGAERLRWSLASEWGRYQVLSTPATARDDAPDADRPAPFPG